MNEEDCEAKMSNENWTATDRDAYRVSSEIRGANIEAMHEVLIELSALLAGQATDFRQVARDLRRMARASLDCSP